MPDDPKAALGGSDPPACIREGRKAMAQSRRDLEAAEKWRDATRSFWLPREQEIQAECDHPAAQPQTDECLRLYAGEFECIRCLLAMSKQMAEATPGGIVQPPAKRR